MDTLPNEMLALVLETVRPIDRHPCRRVCHLWRRLSPPVMDRTNPTPYTTALAREGSVRMLRWAVAEGFPLRSDACAAAAEGGHHDAIEWLRAAGCRWGEDAMRAAAQAGRLETAQWMRSRGCPWGDRSVEAFAASGCVAGLQWALDSRRYIPWPVITMRAVQNGRIDVLDWSARHAPHASNYSAGKVLALEKNDLALLKWFAAHGESMEGLAALATGETKLWLESQSQSHSQSQSQSPPRCRPHLPVEEEIPAGGGTEGGWWSADFGRVAELLENDKYNDDDTNEDEGECSRNENDNDEGECSRNDNNGDGDGDEEDCDDEYEYEYEYEDGYDYADDREEEDDHKEERIDDDDDDDESGYPSYAILRESLFCMHLAQNGDTAALAQAVADGRRWSHLAAVEAAKEGHVHVLAWAVGAGLSLGRISSASTDGAPTVAGQAASNGRVGVLEWLRCNGLLDPVRGGPEVFEYAADNRQHAVLRWAHEHGFRSTAIACSAAAFHGWTDTLRWLREHGVPWSASTCASAASGRHLDTLQWALRNGCPQKRSGGWQRC
jgi:hypothetical protein